MSTTEHSQVTGIIPIRPGHRAGATCTCGWHSHTRTFEQHLAEVSHE